MVGIMQEIEVGFSTSDIGQRTLYTRGQSTCRTRDGLRGGDAWYLGWASDVAVTKVGAPRSCPASRHRLEEERR